MFEHLVDDACEFMGSGRDGDGWALFGFDAAIESAQGTLRTTNALGGKTKGFIGAIIGWLRMATFDLACGRLIIGSQT